MPAGTAKDLSSIWCTPAGDVYAIDRDGDAHDLQGHAGRLPWDRGSAIASAGGRQYQVVAGRLQLSTDGGQTWQPMPQAKPTDSVPYGRSRLARVVVGGTGTSVYALGRYVAVSGSLESDFAFLLRSDDNGLSWRAVWSGPDMGPMGGGHRRGPDVGSALAVLPDATVVLAAEADGSVLISTDRGQTFTPRRTPATAPIADLWVSPAGVLYGVGRHGQVVVSSNGGRTFSAAPSGAEADLTAVTGCGTDVWVVGARGTVLRHQIASPAQ